MSSKNLVAAKKQVDISKAYLLSDAIKLIKDMMYVKFDETLEITMNLGIDPRHSDQMVRGVVVLPSGTGKTMKVAVICKDENIDNAIAAGADTAGNVIDDIKAGNINFDVYIATPDMMGLVGSVARILGPKGLMPNPKLGTVTMDFVTAIKNVKAGQVEFRAEKSGIVHAGIGKLSFASDALVNNVKAFISAILAAKPVGVKGSYIKSIYCTSTMGPSVKIDVADVV